MSYKLGPELLKEMIPKIVEGANNGDAALCRVFALLGGADIYLIFTNKQHKECLELLQLEIGRELSHPDMDWVGTLEREEEKQLMLNPGGSSFGKVYQNDKAVGISVHAAIGNMMQHIGSEYSLR